MCHNIPKQRWQRHAVIGPSFSLTARLLCFAVLNAHGALMDFEDDVIETSDSEEREALCTTQDHYWEEAARDIRARTSVFTRSSTRFSVSTNQPPPRKRIKLDRPSSPHTPHDSSDEARIPELPGKVGNLSRSSSSAPSACPTSPSDGLWSVPDRSLKSSSPIPIPESGQDIISENANSHGDPESDVDSQDPMDMFMTQYRDANDVPLEDASSGAKSQLPNVKLQNTDDTSVPRLLRSRSPRNLSLLDSAPRPEEAQGTQLAEKMPATPYRLYPSQGVSISVASPLRSQRPTSPPLSSEHRSSLEHYSSPDMMPRSTSPRSPLRFPTGSLSSPSYEPAPFTPEPVHLPDSHRPSIIGSPEQHRRSPTAQQSSPLSSAPSPAPAASVHGHAYMIPDDMLIDNEGPSRRYAMRQRRPQQLQPYAYDQIMYKQQMKSNPDAIVKFRRAESPVHRGKASDQAGAEVREADEEATQDWTMDGDEEEDEANSWDQRRDANGGTLVSEGGPASEAQVVPKPRWLPEALRDVSSDEEDDSEIRKMLKEVKMQQKKAKRLEKEKAAAKEREDRARLQREREANRRKKPFPVRIKTAPVVPRRVIKSPAARSATTATGIGNQPHELTSESQSRLASPAILTPSSPSGRSPSRLASPARLTAHESTPGFSGGYDAFEDGQSWADHPDGGVDYQLNSPVSPSEVFPSRSLSQQSDSGDSSHPKLFDARQRKMLGRVWPKFMINDAEKAARLQTTLPAKRRRSVTVESDQDETPLQPGQTRARIGVRGRNMDIKGDSESEDSLSSGLRASDDARSVMDISDDELPPVQRPVIPRSKPQHIPYDSDGSLDETSDDEVDDVQISAWFANRQQFAVPAMDKSREHRVQMRDPHMVDYMLAATRTVGGSRVGRRKQQSSKAKHAVSSTKAAGGRARLDIVTSGAHKGQQTRLTFEGHSKAKHRKRKRPHQSEGSVERNSPTEDADIPLHEEPEALVYRLGGPESAADAAARKRRRAKKRAGLGKYTFAPKHTHITSGHQRPAHAITVDVGDTHFQRALAPARQSRPAPRRTNGVHAHGEHDGKHESAHAITVDIGDTHFQRALAPARQSRPMPRPTSSNVPGEHDGEHMSGVTQPHFELPSPNRPPLPKRHLDFAPVGYHRDIKLDFDIPCLPSGTSFGPNSFIGRGWLKELIALVRGDEQTCVPTFYAAHGIQLSAVMSISELSESLVRVVDGFLAHLVTPKENHEVEGTNHWETLLHTICQHLSQLPRCSTTEEPSQLGETLQEQLLRLLAHVETDSLFGDNGEPSSVGLLNVYWFAIEAWARFSCSMQTAHPDVSLSANDLVKYIALLIDRLLQYGTGKALEPVLARLVSNTTQSVSHRGAELWVCLFHFLSNCQVLPSDDATAGLEHPFWSIIMLAFQRRESQSALEASENVWRTVFGLCAFAQFSMHGMTTSKCGLPASWRLVEFALGKIRLSADPDIDAGLSDQILSKRDEYVWMIASRCYTLSKRWQWKLDNASSMFNHLADIFRSRKFANLRRERSDFPDFMLEHNMGLLFEHKTSDTAFQIFLKLIAHAAKDGEVVQEGLNAQRQALGKLNKLLAMAVPVGSFPFTKASPPTKQELSMLYNRFSALAVNIHLNPSPANIRNRLNHARRCADFKEGDDTTRVACIRAAMHFAVLTGHHSTKLDELLAWLFDMADPLVDEYLQANLPSTRTTSILAKNRTLFSIQILLGAVRRIIDQLASDHPQQYPDPKLMTGPWLARIFAAQDLISSAHTGFEIRSLVQAFLNARQAAMPRPKRPAVVAAVDEESQESQDYYADFDDFDMEDPQFQAALDNDAQSAPINENQSKDASLCNVLDSTIAPAIYRLVCKHLHDPTGPPPSEEYCREADEWVDCWVGCINVIVRNGKRKWSSYLELGPLSWERIIDPSWRRRVGLRFMFMFLRLNPEAYPDYTDRFVGVLLEALATAKISMEHEYFAELLAVDGMRHRLLRRMPCQPLPGTSDYTISATDFMALRSSIIDAILANLAEEIRNKQHHQLQIQTYVGFVAAFLSAMKGTHEEMSDGSDERAVYSAFCRDIREKLQKHPDIANDLRLKTAGAWLHTMDI
ncbi:hypothetical protein FIBSPDRAFT_1040698 [Athelia psychrophila]|uniref:Protein mms22 n=1 Tax=Athelia psychrophila TaxID=1759441 RepID=A0A166Q1P9_9AGAM|nr:hypothetical protein FIBSPDRAFT_1040698 [Fibularhizoctonia sp. CBS 109695]